jgi:hypothetical protein
MTLTWWLSTIKFSGKTWKRSVLIAGEQFASAQTMSAAIVVQTAEKWEYTNG